MRQLLDPAGLLPAVKAREIRTLSYSKLTTADKCLKALEFQLDPTLPYSTGEARAKGSAYHAGLEVYYRWRQAGGHAGRLWHDDVELMEEICTAAWNVLKDEAASEGFVWDTSHGEAWAGVMLMLDRYFTDSCWWPAGWVVVAVEQEFILPMPGRPGWAARGILDLAVTDGWTLVIVDHKSANKPWKKNKEGHRSTPQPDWYLRWIPELYPEFKGHPVRFVYDVMSLNGVFERREAHRHAHQIDTVMLKADGLMDLIEKDGPFPPNVSSFLCSSKWCDHWGYCPYGEQFDSGVLLPVPRRELPMAA